MTTSEYFPDFQHIDAIRRALWTEREFGRAAVMVGAGMSKNAVPLRPGGGTMPTWKEVVRAMIDRLYPAGAGRDDKRSELLGQAAATSAGLRLADEFAAAFGRSTLDELIVGMIPDTDFAPGPLHRLLLDLPWADILTTNYDTLIERAAEGAVGVRYSVVRTQNELPSSPRPRIVKLHGSLPSSGPFILTEEDFRSYPRAFAPFVNLAQQSVLENTLCLVGFSGDDPNFLTWTGWVRDHLGRHAPRVYLCGLLNLSSSQQLLLQSRGVTPVDLAPLFAAKKELSPSQRYALALKWLFLSLREGGPYDPLEWPISPRPLQDPDPNLPALLPSFRLVPREEHWHP